MTELELPELPVEMERYLNKIMVLLEDVFSFEILHKYVYNISIYVCRYLAERMNEGQTVWELYIQGTIYGKMCCAMYCGGKKLLIEQGR